MKCHFVTEGLHIIVPICEWYAMKIFSCHAFIFDKGHIQIYKISIERRFKFERYFLFDDTCVRECLCAKRFRKTWNMLDIVMRPFDNGFIFRTFKSNRIKITFINSFQISSQGNERMCVCRNQR